MKKEILVRKLVEKAILVEGVRHICVNQSDTGVIADILDAAKVEVRNMQKSLISTSITKEGVELLEFYLNNNEAIASLPEAILVRYKVIVKSVIAELNEYLYTGE